VSVYVVGAQIRIRFLSLIIVISSIAVMVVIVLCYASLLRMYLLRASFVVKKTRN